MEKYVAKKASKVVKSAKKVAPSATKSAKTSLRRAYSKIEEKELRAFAKAKTEMGKVVKATKRTAGALRTKARHLGITLGSQPKKKTAKKSKR